MTTTEAFDAWWTESPENFCKAPLGSPECEMHRRTWNAATERAAKQVPMQPVVLAAGGVIRFKENRIVSAFLDNSRRHGYGLNEAARDDYTPEERMQVAQLIGYSVSGYGSLSFVTDESCEEADRHAAAIRARDEGVSNA